jgi:hypothetical protein
MADGYYHYDFAGYSLNQVCQSLSMGHLQVAPPRLGEQFDVPLPPPSRVEPIPGLNIPLINEPVWNLAISRQSEPILKILSIAPTVGVSGGVRAQVMPCRQKIWSPVFEFEGIGLCRQFIWTHADLWWLPERIGLDPSAACEVAVRDLIALEMLVRAGGEFPPQIGWEDASTRSSKTLEGLCDEFLSLIDSDGDDEEMIHQWLRQEPHRIFLDPHAVRVWSKVEFGGKISDFVVRRADGSYRLIEIERSTLRIFQKGNGEPSAAFNHACQQVRDWQRYVRENVYTVRNELHLADIYEPCGVVIAGRSHDIDSLAAERRWRDMKNSSGLAVNTYDDIIRNVRAIAVALRNQLRPISADTNGS